MNSSIFSSRRRAALAALRPDERRWIVLVIGVCVASVVGFFFLKAGLRMWAFDEGLHPTREIDALSPDTRLLFFGSSHVRFGVDPRAMSVPAMNLGVDGLDYVTEEKLVARHLDAVPGLEAAIVEYDVMLLARNIDRFSEDLRRFWRMGLVPADLEITDPLRRLEARVWYYLGPDFFFSRLTPIDVIELVRDPARRRPPGFHPLDGVMTASTDGEARVGGHLIQLRASKTNDPDAHVRALIRIVESLKERGVRVILAQWPHHSTYWEHWPPEFEALYRPALAQLRERWPAPELELWDFGRDPRFADTDFYDGNHLNREGMAKMSRLLDERLAAARP